MNKSDLMVLKDKIIEEKRTAIIFISPSGILPENDPENVAVCITHHGYIYSPVELIKSCFGADPSLQKELSAVLMKVLILQLGDKFDEEVTRQRSGVN